MSIKRDAKRRWQTTGYFRLTPARYMSRTHDDNARRGESALSPGLRLIKTCSVGVCVVTGRRRKCFSSGCPGSPGATLRLILSFSGVGLDKWRTKNRGRIRHAWFPAFTILDFQAPVSHEAALAARLAAARATNGYFSVYFRAHSMPSQLIILVVTILIR